MRTEIRKRLDRAQQRSLDTYVVERDPLVVEVDSHHSGNTYTVLPETAYCGCEDRRYRGVPCWHLLYLATAEDVDTGLRTAVTDGLFAREESIEDDLAGLQDDLSELRDDLSELRDDLGMWSSAVHVVDEYHDAVDDPDAFLSGSENQHGDPDAITRVARTARQGGD